MRLSLAILILTIGLITKGNAYGYKPAVDTLVAKCRGNHIKNGANNSTETTNSSTEGHELKKAVQTTPGYILHLLSRFCYTSIEARHFLDAFFVSFFAYYTTYNSDAKDFYLTHHIATKLALEIIYPYHSFW
ncbi:MAG: hypothetical protein JWQ40_1236 [Segetibacter sp.]|nr:hypothetical protein [Segetibacter sp.]